MRNVIFSITVVTALVGCSGHTVDVGGYGNATAPDTDGGVFRSPDGATTTSGANVEIHLLASTAAFPHSDGLSSQTPIDQKIGIRSLRLLTSATDPAPLLVFDHGTAAVESGLNDKDDTIVAKVPAAGLTAGKYTFARVGISHVRYRVAATMHSLGQSVAGTFQNVHVLTGGSIVDGAARSAGHYSFTFEVGGTPLATQEGENGPLPIDPSSGGITMDTSGTEAAYVFPIAIPVDPNVASDVKMIFEINTNENFRWQDETTAGNQSRVFDVTPTAYEPVKSFGANSFRLVAEFSGTGDPAL